MGIVYHNIGGIVNDSLMLHVDPARHDSFQNGDLSVYSLVDRDLDTRQASLTNGTQFITNQGKGCFYFDGTNDQILYNKATNQYNPIYLTGAWTCSMWIKSTISTCGIFSHWSGGPVNLALGLSGGKMDFYYYDGQWNAGPATTGTSVNTGNWTNIVWVRPVVDTDPVKMYVNGVLDFELTPRISWGNYNMGNLGARWSYLFYSGYLSQVLVYNRVLEDHEIDRNYNAMRSRFGV